ncbi:MAG: hypothetical protein WD512_06115, partial [Candidatus Paceibacterota bacterium]
MKGYGFVDIEHGTYHREKHEDAIFHRMKTCKSKEILFHHRSPTSTPNMIETAHPIFTKNKVYEYNYYLTHNGVIRNAELLKNLHKKEFKIKYTTEVKVSGDKVFNDSESLLHELALFIEGKKETMSACGTMAFILLQSDKNGKPINLYYGRNSSKELKMFMDKKELIISSDGKGSDVDEDKLWKYSYKHNNITAVDLDFALITTTSWRRDSVDEEEQGKKTIIEYPEKFDGIESQDRMYGFRNMGEVGLENEYMDELDDFAILDLFEQN